MHEMKFSIEFPSLAARSPLVVALLAVSALTALDAAGPPAPDDVLPEQPPATKYDLMAAHSPFSPPTPGPNTQATPPPPPTPAWSDSLTVKGVMQNGNIFVAFVEDANNPHHYAIRSDREEPESHLTLASVKWPNRADQPKVTVRRGATDFAELKYDPTVSGSAPSAGGGPPIPGMARPLAQNPGGGGGVPNTAFRPPPVANNPVSAPGIPGQPRGAVIRRPIIQASPPPAARNPLNRPVLPNGGAVVKPGAIDDDDDDD